MKAIGEEVKKAEADLVCFQEVKAPMLQVLLDIDYFRDNYFLSDINGSTLGGYGVVRNDIIYFLVVSNGLVASIISI